MTTRRIVSIVVLVLFSLVLAACGGGAATPTTVPPTEAPATQPPTPETTEVATAETATSDSEATEEAASGEVTVSIAQINTALRSGPGTTYEVVARTQVSETFPVVAQYGEGRDLWYQVTLPDGTSAWAWSRVATLNPPDAVVPVAEEVPPAP